jgi:hypothetical protein
LISNKSRGCSGVFGDRGVGSARKMWGRWRASRESSTAAPQFKAYI